MKNTLSIFIAMIIFTSCKKDNNNTPAAATTTPAVVDSNLGTFIGDLQVYADFGSSSSTSGNIYNAKATVIFNGSVATFKVIGDGFDREYKGNLTQGNGPGNTPVYMIYMDKQTKPIEKIATGINNAISGNSCMIHLDMASDTVTVKNTKGGNSFVLSGKIRIVGSLIRQ